MIDPPAPEHDEVDDAAIVPEVIPDVPVAAGGAARPASGRKSLGVKEPIVFKWKLIGRSNGLYVTLFKSTEREEAEAQLTRLTAEGYYSDVQILEADAKVTQPAAKEPKKAAKSREPAAAKAPERSAVKKPVRGRIDVAKSAPAKRTPAKTAAKTAVRAAKPKRSKTATRKAARTK